MTTVLPAADPRVGTLCALYGHDVGPDRCREEKCRSATIVGLHAAARLGRQAVGALVCGCASPGECSCEVERERYRFAHATAWTEAALRVLAGVWWAQAEQILNGTEPAYCAMHQLTPLPCPHCEEEEG